MTHQSTIMTKSSIEFMTLEDRSKFDHMAMTVMAEGLRIEGMEFQNMIDRTYNAEQQLNAAGALIKDKDEEIASLRKDAERYRWLRDETMLKVKPSAKVVWRVQPEMQQERWADSSGKYQIDAAIDAAITKEQK